ncbi:MAG: NADP-dependent phosphogluconate dehydrogenase [Flavobacteriaceae bacterium]
MKHSEIGIIGLGVMGKSLTRNLAQKGFQISMYNRHVEGQEENVARDFQQSFPELHNSQAFDDLQGFVDSLATPRKILMMIPAGAAIDDFLEQIESLLQPNDILVDGGNSHFEDTQRRMGHLQKKGIHFIGAGISGGQLGALHGPSIMPSGDLSAYEHVQKFLEAISAKDAQGNPCCTYIGPEGSGHFVKMIHNGIEYVEMQLLAECYFLLRQQAYSNHQMADIFENWRDDLDSYLLQITVDILRKKEGEEYVLDTILDQAENKGTGKWSTQTIATAGSPAGLIPTALLVRYLSSFKSKRVQFSKEFAFSPVHPDIALDDLKATYGLARIINHHQGFWTIVQWSSQQNWQLNLSEIARVWTQGCIIQSDLMAEIKTLLKQSDEILSTSAIRQLIVESYPKAQRVVSSAINASCAVPCFSETVQYFQGLITADSPANLLQAQRDFFGEHTYLKKGDPLRTKHTTEW